MSETLGKIARAAADPHSVIGGTRTRASSLGATAILCGIVWYQSDSLKAAQAAQVATNERNIQMLQDQIKTFVTVVERNSSSYEKAAGVHKEVLDNFRAMKEATLAMEKRLAEFVEQTKWERKGRTQ